MNIEKLKYFIDVVEYRSFTKAAKVNFVSQTTISQQMASLEEEFKVLLINRKKIPIEPTNEGLVMYKDAKVIWKQYFDLKEKMEQLKSGCMQTITVGYSNLTEIEPLFEFITVFNERFPTIQIDLKKVILKDSLTQLKSGIFDCVLSIDPEISKDEMVENIEVSQGRYSAVVGKNHELFKEKEIHTQMLYHYPLIMLSPQVIGRSLDEMLNRSKKEGFHPIIERTAEDVDTQLFHILTNNLIGFLPENHLLHYPEEMIRLIPMEESTHLYKVYLAHMKDNSDPILLAFVKAFGNWLIQ